MVLDRRADEADHLLVLVRGDVACVDEEHLVALVEARDADVCRSTGRHARHDDGHALIAAALATHATSSHNSKGCHRSSSVAGLTLTLKPKRPCASGLIRIVTRPWFSYALPFVCNHENNKPHRDVPGEKLDKDCIEDLSFVRGSMYGINSHTFKFQQRTTPARNEIK